MVERLDLTFHALADPTRRGMLANLAQGEKSIGELAQPYAMTLAGASKHVQVLERADMKKLGMNTLLSVAAGSGEAAIRRPGTPARPPRVPPLPCGSG